MSSTGLHPDVARLAEVKGLSEFTEVQAKAFPLILEGKNVLLIAPTGFGKTEAAMLPVLSKLAEQKGEGVQVLYLTPLKALNRDMLERLRFYCKMLGLRLGVRHGDTSSYERVKQKARPPHVLISTPESLNALLVAGMRDSLKNVRFVVVDEVHELAYSKRGVQLSLALERLRLLSRFQIIGLSATVYSPEDVAAFLGKGVEVVDCSHLRSMKLEVTRGSSGKALSGLSAETSSRLKAIEALVKSHSKTLIFVNTRFMAEALGALLGGVLGEDFAVHHSSLSKEARLEVEEEFKRGSLKALVCTSSLELGMDIGEVDLVIQMGSPRQVSRLVQRVGRSGHRKHLTPKGVILALDEMDALEAEVLVRRAHEAKLDVQRKRQKALDVLAQQLCGLIMEYGPVRLEHALKVFREAEPFKDVSLEDLQAVAQELASSGIIASDGKTVESTKRLRFYYYENLSTIPDEKRFFVKNAETNKNVAMLDEAFVSNYLAEGASFIARGKAWKVLSVSDDEVVVEPCRDFSAAIPDWIGEEIPVTMDVARDVASVLKEEGMSLECRDTACVLHSFLGHKANEAIAKGVSILFSLQGKSVRSRASAYTIIFEFSRKAEPDKLVENLLHLRSVDARSFLKTNLFESPLFLRRFVHVAKRFGLLRKDRDYNAISVKRLAALMKNSVISEEVFSELFYDKIDLSAFSFIPFRVPVASVEKWSSLAKNALDAGGFSELYVAAEPTEKVLEAFAEELRAKKVKLRCTYCKQFFSKTLGSFPEPKCIFCSSNQIVPDEFFGKKEQKKVASLVSAYGQKALYALSVYGVGPETAARLLGRLQKTDESLFYDLLTGQKEFIRTKRFWRA
ncbi:DEAD/DEAH box helicase [Candidatus Micrarchaeota archaeon]|nr:DEAD/DEAH box helicase [Candidatus Micrarchaeota archaeon]